MTNENHADSPPPVKPDQAAAAPLTPWARREKAALAGRAHHTWAALSEACHHHAYELAPGQAQCTYVYTFEVEGAPKPSCVAEVIVRVYE